MKPVLLLEGGNGKVTLDFVLVIPGLALRVQVNAAEQLEHNHTQREQVFRGIVVRLEVILI